MGGWFIICYHISPYPIYICILYIIIYIYILCVCVFAIQVPHISPHCIATCPILVVFWTAKNQDDVVRQAIIPLSAPHQSDAGAVETAFFFGFGCWNLWWFYGILNHTTGRLLILRYMMLWCYISGASEKSIPTAIKLRKWRRKHQLLAVR